MSDAMLEIGDLPAGSLRWARTPRFRHMSNREMAVVLSRNQVGRIAYHGDGRLELVPVHYVYAEGAIIGRTSLGTKYLSWLTRDQVVFEVDESQGLYDWRSVITRGRVRILTPQGSPDERAAWNEAVAALRRLTDGAMTERDPTPHRSVVFVIAPTQMTGRLAVSR